jgi:AcrR family transcriptional regulator
VSATTTAASPAAHSPSSPASPTEDAPAPGLRVAPAKGRILATAMRRFYDDGIRPVGVDLLISESQVTKATFYKHFGSKDRLVLDYITARRDATLESITSLLAAHEDAAVGLRLVGDAVVAQIQAPGYRGCPFVNAAAEFADPAHPVRGVVTGFHESIHELFEGALVRLGHPMPGEAADRLVLAYVGAMTWAYVGDVIAASSAVRGTIERITAEAR